MSEKFKNKYRIDSIRLQKWDYAWSASYFITICTYKREHLFGGITNKTMHLSELGQLAAKHWHEISERFPYTRLDEFVVMPNHIHGIIVIDNKKNQTKIAQNDDHDGHSKNDNINEQKNQGGVTGNKNPMLHYNLSRVVRWYKGRVTFESRKIHADFAWQARFYEHIIRNDKSYHNISEYIRNNPMNWDSDRFSQ